MRLRLLWMLVGHLVAVASHGSITTAEVRGRVLTGGQPASGVEVSLACDGPTVQRSARTDADGTYVIASLLPGECEITFSREGLQSLSRPVLLELGRAARADATLEVSDEGESVTSTLRPVNVTETPVIVTHFGEYELDRLPVVRTPAHIAELSPSPPPYFAVIDDVVFREPALLGEEVVDETASFSGVLPLHIDRFTGGLMTAKTRSGGNEFSLTLRDTLSSWGWIADGTVSELFQDDSSGVLHVFESAAGGRIVPDRLWFFAAGWSGDSADRVIEDLAGYEIKLDAAPGAAHRLTAQYLRTEASRYPNEYEASAASLRYLGVFSERLTVDAVAAHSTAGYPEDIDYGLVRGSYWLSAAGDHLLTFGGSFWPSDGMIFMGEERNSDTWAVFLSDRYRVANVSILAGLRHEEGEDRGATSPRAAVTWDVTGNGRHALSARYGKFEDVQFFASATDVFSAGYAIAFGSSGLARVDYVQREDNDVYQSDSIEVEGRYRLFGRMIIGATYVRFQQESDFQEALVSHASRAWFGSDISLGTHTLSGTVLQHLISDTGGRDYFPTDVAIRYMVPIRAAALTLAIDAMNLFDSEPRLPHQSRTLRGWVRVTL